MDPKVFCENIKQAVIEGNFYLLESDQEISKFVKVLIDEGKLAILDAIIKEIPSHLLKKNPWNLYSLRIEEIRNNRYNSSILPRIKEKLKISKPNDLLIFSNKYKQRFIDKEHDLDYQRDLILYFSQIKVQDWIDMAIDLISCFFVIEFYEVSHYILDIYAQVNGLSLKKMKEILKKNMGNSVFWNKSKNYIFWEYLLNLKLKKNHKVIESLQLILEEFHLSSVLRKRLVDQMNDLRAAS